MRTGSPHTSPPIGDADRCGRCGEPFHCGARAPGCWCSALPALDPLPAGLGPHCLCERCLRAALAAHAAQRNTDRTAPC